MHTQAAIESSPGVKTQKKKRQYTGVVVSDAMQKTIVVKVVRIVKHRLYHKYIRRSKTYKVHDERNEARVGDTVLFVACRPLSKEKRWRFMQVLKRSTTVATP